MSEKSDTLTAHLFGNDTLIDSQKPNASVEIFEKVVSEIFSKKSIKLKTDINERQILAFSRASVFARKYKRPLLKALINEISMYSVSKNRQSRKEFENIAKANLGMAQDEEKRTIPNRLMGRV